MSKIVTAAIVATGNEIVSGQILNTNTRYLADELSQKGVEVEGHFSVLDRREDLKDIFIFLQSKSIDHVFVIGGLGPTSDDLTRYIVADFCEQEFEFNHETWSKVADFLKDSSIALQEGHKKQCYFPVGSEILLNSVGTAQGFKVSKDKMTIWCLPGPPAECRSIYENAINPWVLDTVRAKKDLLTWQCTGVPESDLSSRIETALKDCPYEIGFRASPPIVELKLWVPSDHMGGVAQMWIDEVEKVVSPSLYSRQGQNYFKEIFDFLIEQGDVDIIDEYSMGYIYEELLEHYKGVVPAKINFSTKPMDYLSENMVKLRPEGKELELSFSSIDKNFNIKTDLDPLKSLESKRYRKLKCAELVKKMHKEFFYS